MEDLISIIVPVYKTEKYLDKCINSICRQTYKNLEIILIDDGSPDNCPQICDDWAEKDNRIKVIHKSNEGVMLARQSGYTIAQGKYISFVDSDDWIDEYMIDYLYSLLKSNNATVSSCFQKPIYEINNADFSEDNSEPSVTVYQGFHNIFKSIMEDCITCLCGKLYDREVLLKAPRFKDNVWMREDYMASYFFYKNVDRLVVSSKQLYYYYRHIESVMQGVITEKKIDDSIKVFETVGNDFDKKSELYPYHVYNSYRNDFFLINSIIRNNTCWNRFKELRLRILNIRKYAFNRKYNNVFKFRDRAGIIIIWFFPKPYIKYVLIKKRIRGY